MRIIRESALAAAVLLCAAPAAITQVVTESVNLDAIARIREVGLNHSQIDALAKHLTDVIGPRLTGSPNLRTANLWTAERLREWGLQRVEVEPWGEFGRGWEAISYSGRIVEPYAQILRAYPIAWTGSTDGTIRGEVIVVEADSIADLDRYRGRLSGAIVLRDRPQTIEPEFQPRLLRYPTDYILGPEMDRRLQDRLQQRQRFRERRALGRAMAELFAEEGVAAVLQPSSRAYGILRPGGSSAGRDVTKPIPAPELMISHEQHGQIFRNIESGKRVVVELNVQNHFFEDDLQAYNTVGEIPGTDKADEYDMVGAHLDSWHAGTGATDNGAGSVVMMEAVRILQALDLKPRRTIRIALWTGEEQGLLGSEGWLENHRDQWSRISAYLNVDSGTGRLRGAWDMGNLAAAPILEQIFVPFRDLGVVAIKSGSPTGSDHVSFDKVGILGISFLQDPIEYSTRTHHTFADTYERLVIDDLKQAAVVVAATAYHLAMRDELMPRKPEKPATQ